MAPSYIIRHGAMRLLGEYDASDGNTYPRGSPVVVRSDRGLEVGDVLCEANPRAVALISEPTHGRILRLFTAEDRAIQQKLKEGERREFGVCQTYVRQRKLQMELVDVEHLFGGERVIF